MGSITTRLVALVFVPLLAVGYLGFDTVQRERDNTAVARQVVVTAELRQAVAAVVGPAQLEQLALEGLNRIDELGIPRPVVSELSGVDFVEVYRNNVPVLDGVLDDLVADYGDLVLADGQTLSTRISFARGALATQRSLSDDGLGRRDDVRGVFDLLDATLDESLATSAPMRSGSISAEAVNERERLAALRTVQTSAGERGRALLDGLVGSDENSALQIISSDAQLSNAVDVYRLLLDTDDQSEFDVVNEDLIAIPVEILVLGRDGSSILDPGYVGTAATTFLEQLDYLHSLGTYSAAVHADSADRLIATADAAESLANRTFVLTVTLIVGSAVLAVLIGLSCLRPLRRLRRRATQVGEGDLNHDPLPVTGPTDLRMLTMSMNGMLNTLQAVDQEVRSMAASTPGTQSMLDVPGDIGASLRQSFERLAEVTGQLAASEELASAIVDQAADGIWTIDASGSITSANESSEAIIGIAAAGQIGTPIRDHLSTLDGEVLIERDDEIIRCLVASSPIVGGDEPLTAVIAHDISEHLRFEQKLAYQAHHDALTKLPNRYALLEHMDGLVHGDSVAILFIDLDGFKTVNDVQGHLAGDAVLEEISARLLGCIRPCDLVGRIGGDEFVVVMRDFDDVAAVVSFGERLIREIEMPYENGTKAFTISASVGVAVFDDGIAAAGLGALEAIQQADSAVYLAKRRGRGRVEIFDNELQSAIVRDADLEMALRGATSAGELELKLQPIMDLANGEFSSAEALVRWNRPGVGLVSPGDFIPVAERSGIIYEIEQWVLHQACATLARWRQLDPFCMTKIAVNVSGRHLLEGDLLIDLHKALRATGADPNMLEIELTESQLLDDLDRATTILDAVRAHGITVAIDDFGTGYSSMSYLQQLPIDTLKIDRKFVSTINEDEFDSTVLDALLTIAHALDVSVVAEGIEEASQLEHLRERGCQRGQGFLLARPIPIPQAEAIMGIGLATRPQFDVETMQMLSRTVSAL